MKFILNFFIYVVNFVGMERGISIMKKFIPMNPQVPSYLPYSSLNLGQKKNGRVRNVIGFKVLFDGEQEGAGPESFDELSPSNPSLFMQSLLKKLIRGCCDGYMRIAIMQQSIGNQINEFVRKMLVIHPFSHFIDFTFPQGLDSFTFALEYMRRSFSIL